MHSYQTWNSLPNFVVLASSINSFRNRLDKLWKSQSRICNYGNSLDKLRHTRSVAYSVELVLLNKHQISGGGAYLDYYRYYEDNLT